MTDEARPAPDTPAQAMQDLIDIGANLGHDSFDADLDAVIQRARTAGVSRFILTGATVAGSRKAVSIAQNYAGYAYATAGVHPHHASEYGRETTDALREIAADPAVVSLGECGLDHFRNFSTPAQQEKAFRAQLELASELQMPVFLHQRDAGDAFFAIVREYRDRITTAVAHCFTGTDAEMAACLELDLYVGITGWICDERRGTHLRDLVPRIPADRLMIETDAPYLMPRDLIPKPASRRNEPQYLPHVLAAVADAAGRPIAQVAQETSANARRFFRIF